MKTGLYWTLEQASTFAHEVDLLFIFIFAVCGIFALLIASLVVFMAARFRHSAENDKGPEEVHESVILELIWTAIPLGLALFMFAWGAKVYVQEARPPADTIDIAVVGKQWMWKAQHPDGKKEINELHVPVGRPVKLILTSEDVIHSFYVPAFRLKMDAVPGRYTTAWFEPSRVGEYHLFCAEYCGTKHAGMIGRVTVMPEAQYERWLSSLGAGDDMLSLSQRGEKLFERYGCRSCHSGDSGARGPNLKGLYGKSVILQDGRVVTADETYMRESIVAPMAKIVKGYEAIMPMFATQIDEDSMMAIVAYLKKM